MLTGPSDSVVITATHRHTPPYAKANYEWFVLLLKTSHNIPKTSTVRPQPSPVRNVRMALAPVFVCRFHCLGREYSYSGYPLCLTEPRLLMQRNSAFPLNLAEHSLKVWIIFLLSIIQIHTVAEKQKGV